LTSNGKTIAVMGCGPDVYYPSKNKELQNHIEKSGLIVSEYPFGSRVSGLSLKKRNKIIVGLSEIVYITETSVKGGTMNSYLASIEQKKPVNVFLPISQVGGNFYGNLKIFNDKRIIVNKITTYTEPKLEKLRKVKAIIFDLDGTIWDSRKAILLTLKSILKENEKEFDEKKIKHQIHSLDSPFTILKSFGITRSASFWRFYREKYNEITLFSKSTKHILTQISETNKKLGIVTTLKGKIAQELLEKFFLDKIFSVVISPSDTRARKPSPVPIEMALKKMRIAKEEAIYIGDSRVDIRAAEAAKCYSGLAGWNESAVTSEKPDYIFSSLEDLLLFTRKEQDVLRL